MAGHHSLREAVRWPGSPKLYEIHLEGDSMGLGEGLESGGLCIRGIHGAGG